MGRNRNGHGTAVDRIAGHPEKFGFKNIISVAKEKVLYHEGKKYVSIDVTIETEGREGNLVHLVEFKGNGNGEAQNRAQIQFGMARWWYGRYKPDISPHNILTQIISGDDPKYADLLRGCRNPLEPSESEDRLSV